MSNNKTLSIFINVLLVSIEFLFVKDLLKIMDRIILYILISTMMMINYECKSVGVLDNLIKIGEYSRMYNEV